MFTSAYNQMEAILVPGYAAAAHTMQRLALLLTCSCGRPSARMAAIQRRALAPLLGLVGFGHDL